MFLKRNSYSGPYLHYLDPQSLNQLFDDLGDNTYLNWERHYLQHRYHINEFIQSDSLSKSNGSDTQFDTLLRTHSGDKPLLICDVDHTLLFVQFFTREMCIDDIVTYYIDDEVECDNARIVSIQLRLTLDISEHSSLITKFEGSNTIDFHFTITDESQRPRRGLTFDYPLCNEYGTVIDTIALPIVNVEPSACSIVIRDEDESNHSAFEPIFIPFFDANNTNLSKFEPCLNRSDTQSVDFIYEGFLVRCRPGLADFFDSLSDDFDIVIYTSADPSIYKGLLKAAHEYLGDMLGRDIDDDEEALWHSVLYRDDCTLNYDNNGTPYHAKDLTRFGVDLSRVIMLDNSAIALRGFEPNTLLIKDWFGNDGTDDELLSVISPILDELRDCRGDIRYILSDIPMPPSMNQLSIYDASEKNLERLTVDFVKSIQNHLLSSNRSKSLTVSISQLSLLSSVSASLTQTSIDDENDGDYRSLPMSNAVSNSSNDVNVNDSKLIDDMQPSSSRSESPLFRAAFETSNISATDNNVVTQTQRSNVNQYMHRNRYRRFAVDFRRVQFVKLKKWIKSRKPIHSVRRHNINSQFSLN